MGTSLFYWHISKIVLFLQKLKDKKVKLLPLKAALHGMRASSPYNFYYVLTTRILPLIFFLLGTYGMAKTLSKGISLPTGFNDINNNITTIIIITPTHKRLERLADMTRLSQTLQHVPNLHWIVVEDGNRTAAVVERVLFRSGIPYIYLHSKTAPGMPPRGWTHRNLALNYIRENYEDIPAVVYFGDDDNTYDVRLFTEYIRNVKRIGLWAVGLVGGAYVEAPKVNEKGKISAWNVVFAPNRKFATDMAGFAINLKEIKRVNASFNEHCAKNYKQGPESCFLAQFGLPKEEAEPFGHDRQPPEILVWHTKTTKTATAKGPTYGYNVEK